MVLKKFLFFILIGFFPLVLTISCKEFIFKKNNNFCNRRYVKNYYLHEDSLYGAEINPTCEPIGGGNGYSKIISKYNLLVRNREELFDALKNAKKGDIIFISDTSKIDLTDYDKIEIPGGITLASDRGINDSKGALIFSNDLNKIIYSLFLVQGEGTRITGLRIQGPDSTSRWELFDTLNRKKYYSIPTSGGIKSTFSQTEIDNCEISGWGAAAITIVSPKNVVKTCKNNYIHNNYIHHNQRTGLGYGISLDNAEAFIEGNIFDWCRHGIQGTGRPNTAYEARFNIVKHANFDMHGGRDRKDKTSIAGKFIKIHHNTFFLLDNVCVLIRGIPTDQAEIYNNLFYQTSPEKAVYQHNAKGNMKVFNNKYGTTIVKESYFLK